MELIDKANVVAEIDKLITSLRKSCNPNPLGTMIECLTDAQIEALSIVKELIEDVNTKEVDLNKEIESSMNNLCELGCYAQTLLDNPEGYEGFAKPFPKEVDDELSDFAKHFFELGLKAQKGE